MVKETKHREKGINETVEQHDTIMYIELRAKYLSRVCTGLQRSKKEHPENWTKENELEFIKIHQRKREIEATYNAIKSGEKAISILTSIDKLKAKLNKQRQRTEEYHKHARKTKEGKE